MNILPKPAKRFLLPKTVLNKNFYVITGGPGVGKTNLLLELHKKGFLHMPEAARQIIQEQVESGGDALPWGNVEKYRNLMLERSVEIYLSAKTNSDEILFFDRGIPDTLAYSKLINLNISDDLESAVEQHRYNQKVFILPPWEEIYHTDSERKQDFKEAVKTFDVMIETYRQLGYELVQVPKISATERAEYVLAIILREQDNE